jgi:hypothetical protein
MPLQLVTDDDLEILEAFQAAGSMPIVDALTRRVGNPAWAESRMMHVILRAWRLTEPDDAGMQTGPPRQVWRLLCLRTPCCQESASSRISALSNFPEVVQDAAHAVSSERQAV